MAGNPPGRQGAEERVSGMNTSARLGHLLIFLLLLPAASLAWGAWRRAELEVEARRASWKRSLELHRTSLELQARVRAQSFQIVLQGAAWQAEASRVVAYSRDGLWLGYDPAGAAPDEPITDPDAERYYILSRRGGESYEARGDPARAVDAYSFFLPRVHSPVLRARLRLSAARAADRVGNTALSRALLTDVLETAAGSRTEEGLPADIVSALKLLERPAPGDEDIRQKLRERVEIGLHRVSTPLLARVVEVLGSGGEGFREVIEARRVLERAVHACPEVLAADEAAVTDDSIVVAKSESVNGRIVRTLRAAPWLPPARLIPGDTQAVTWGASPPKSAEGGIAAQPITLRDGGPVLGHVAVAEGTGSEVLPPAVSSSSIVEARVYVVLQLVFLLLCCVNLVVLFRRERQVARLRERLLANVSHELKTPVTSVRMFAELLGQPGVDPAEARHFAGHLRRESARLSQLLENLLDLSRPERIEARLAREPVDARALLREVADGFAYRAREAGVEFRTEGLDGGDPGDAIVLETNGQAVERVVLNLLDNALKYRRAEGSRVTLRLLNGGNGVSVVVEDNGPGIPLRDRSRVFEEFYRGRFDDYAVKGAGLGLSIARRLARKLGGDVQLESREGAGSTFSLVLPGAPPPGRGAAA